MIWTQPKQIGPIEGRGISMLPPQMRETKDPNTFKTMMKNWIWEKIPSY